MHAKCGYSTDIELPEVILAWDITFDQIQDDGLVEVCTLWVVSSSATKSTKPHIFELER